MHAVVPIEPAKRIASAIHVVDTIIHDHDRVAILDPMLHCQNHFVSGHAMIFSSRIEGAHFRPLGADTPGASKTPQNNSGSRDPSSLALIFALSGP